MASSTPTPASTTSAAERDYAVMRFLPAAGAISMLFKENAPIPGADMKVKYKETARGGLAVNVIEC